DAPRKEIFYSTKSDPYTYGSGKGIRTYYPHRYVVLEHAHLTYKNPLWTCFCTNPDCTYSGQIFPSCIAQKLFDDTGILYEACFINYYEGNRDHLGWHADDSDVIDMDRPIAVVTFGAEREIWFREKGSDVIDKQLLH